MKDLMINEKQYIVVFILENLSIKIAAKQLRFFKMQSKVETHLTIT